MTAPATPKLPPMTALEFAIASVFRHFFFGLRLAILWAILLVPLMVLAWYLAFRDGVPDVKALKPEAIAAIAVLGVGLLLAMNSIAVNWHRRIVLGETPRRFGWVRLNGVVWKYLLAWIFVMVVVAILGAAAAAAAKLLPGYIAEQAGPAANPVGIGLAVLLGLSALFTWYRLSSWLPAVATGDKEYSAGTAWRATRKNRAAYVFFTFWLLFSCAIAGALGAAAVFGAQNSGVNWATPVAFGFTGLLGWLALFLVCTIATSHYCHFAQRDVFPKNEG